MNDIRGFIRNYQRAVRESIQELCAVYPAFDRREFARSPEPTIPHAGTLPSGRTFSFHGFGCYFQCGQVVVDVDFGPDGRIDGFDAWRLSLFAKSLNVADVDHKRLKELLRELERKGEIESPPRNSETWVVGSDLYFWTGALAAQDDGRP
jgi:hypothetical protein